MVRVKYTTLAKLFAIFFFALFIIPSLLKFLSGPNDDDFHGGIRVGHGGGGGDGGGGKMPHEDVKRGALHDDDADLHPELEAVFKEGVIGNYEPVNLEPRSGPGEGGVPVQLDPSEKSHADRTVAEFGFNMVASDKISLDRRIKDTRPDE